MLKKSILIKGIILLLAVGVLAGVGWAAWKVAEKKKGGKEQVKKVISQSVVYYKPGKKIVYLPISTDDTEKIKFTIMGERRIESQSQKGRGDNSFVIGDISKPVVDISGGRVNRERKIIEEIPQPVIFYLNVHTNYIDQIKIKPYEFANNGKVFHVGMTPPVYYLSLCEMEEIGSIANVGNITDECIKTIKNISFKMNQFNAIDIAEEVDSTKIVGFKLGINPDKDTDNDGKSDYIRIKASSEGKFPVNVLHLLIPLYRYRWSTSIVYDPDIEISYGSYPKNISIDIGNDGSKEWSYSGQLSEKIIVKNFGEALDNYLNTGELKKEACQIPIAIYSGSEGKIKVEIIKGNDNERL